MDSILHRIKKKIMDIKIQKINSYLLACNLTEIKVDNLPSICIEIIYNLYECDTLPNETIPLPVECYFFIGLYYKSRDIEKMKKYLLLAIENGDVVAMRLMALHYKSQTEYDLMEKYFGMAIEKGDIQSMMKMAVIEENKEHYQRSIMYYLMVYMINEDNLVMKKIIGHFPKSNKKDILPVIEAVLIQKNNIYALKQLAGQIEYIDFDLAKKYYKIAIKAGDFDAMYLLGKLHHRKKNNAKMIKYLLMAINYNYKVSEIREMLINSLSVNQLIDLLINLQQNNTTMKFDICQLEKKLKEKEEEITDLTYRPGGPGYLEAKNHFDSLCNEQ